MSNQHITETAKALLEENKKQVQEPKNSSPLKSQLRIPTQRPTAHQPLQKQRATQHVTKEWTPEVAHTHEISSHFSSTTKSAGSLKIKQVRSFPFKKAKEILQKIKEMHTKESCKVGKRISIIHETTAQQKEQSDQNELWKEMIKTHEERHFQIGRITNFFS